MLRPPETLQGQGTTGSASRFASVMNMSATLMGTSFLAMPFAYSKFGVMLGQLVFVAVAVICSYCYHLLSVCVLKEKIILTKIRDGAHKYSMRTRENVLAETPEDSSFMSLIQRTIPGAWANQVVDVAIALNCLGCGVGMLVVMGDIIPGIYEYWVSSPKNMLKHRTVWVTLFAWLISFPLSLQSTMSGGIITPISMILIVGVAAVSVLFYNFDTSSSAFEIKNELWNPCDKGAHGTYLHCTIQGRPKPIYWHLWESLGALSIMINGYSCAYNMPSIIQELKRPTIARASHVVGAASFFTTIVYIVSSYACFLVYGNKLNSDMLVNFPSASWVSIACQMAIVSVLVVSVRLMVHPTRNSVAHLAYGKDAAALENTPYYTLTFGICVLMWGLSLLIKDLGTILSFVGSLIAVPLIFILPPWFYIIISVPSLNIDAPST